MIPRIVLPFALTLLCVSPLVAKESKCDAALARIDKLFATYRKEHPVKEYPSSLKEFQNFAAKKGGFVDLSVFSQFRFHRHSRGLGILFTCKDTGEGGGIEYPVVTAH
jgi:hypothetical protein